MIKDVDLKIVNKLSYSEFRFKQPIVYIPSPVSKDYAIAFIDRYFTKKISDGTIIETSPRDYQSVNTTFFIKETIKWQIRGLEKNKYDGKILVEYGVGEYNKLQVSNAAKKIPGIQNVLTNYFQFWLGY